MTQISVPARFVIALALALSAAVSLAAAEAEFQVGNPWVSLPIYDEAPRAYFAIRNPTAKARRIVAATSPRCKSIELRIATFESGVGGSKKLDEIEIPPGGAAAFSARGYFLELVGSDKLAEQERFPIELELDDGTKVRFAAEVRDE